MSDAMPTPDEPPLLSGFMNHDYVLTFSVADDAKRAELIRLCIGPWQGDQVTDHTWEISNDLDPHAMEEAIVALLDEGDRAAYYYLTPPMASGLPGAPETKRIFRVVLS
jgi:hypothetical protein